jgi:hypothetical protein
LVKRGCGNAFAAIGPDADPAAIARKSRLDVHNGVIAAPPWLTRERFAVVLSSDVPERVACPTILALVRLLPRLLVIEHLVMGRVPEPDPFKSAGFQSPSIVLACLHVQP